MARKSLSPGAGLVAQALQKSFASVEVELLEQLTRIYRAHVDKKFEEFMAAVADPVQYKGRISEGAWSNSPFKGWYNWTTVDQAEQRAAGLIPGSPISYWADIRLRPQMIKKSYYNADKDAKVAYTTARDSFVQKNLGKITNVLSGREDIEVVLADFSFDRGVFAGKVYVSLKNGDELTAHVSLKYVVRYIPNVTPYYQYPLLFSKAIVGKQRLTSPSEEELRVAFGGGAKPTAEQMRAEAGLCPKSGEYVPREQYAPISRMMSPYVKCPTCLQTVSARGGKYRAHKVAGGR